MAAEEKTEKPTAKKRRDQRKEGNVASSKDVIMVASLLGGFWVLQLLFPMIYESMQEAMEFQVRAVAQVNDLSLGFLQQMGMDAVVTLSKCIFPLGVISIAISVVATGVQTRFLFTMKPLGFKLNKLNPLKGLKNLF